MLKKSTFEILEKAAPVFVGPRGGKYKDSDLTIPWKDGEAEGAGGDADSEPSSEGPGAGFASDLDAAVKQSPLKDEVSFKTATMEKLSKLGVTEVRNHANMLRLIAGGMANLAPTKKMRESLKQKHAMSTEEKAVAAG